MNAGKIVTSFNTTTTAEAFATTDEQTGIQRVLSNVIAFRSAASPINVESLATALVEGLLPTNPQGGTYDPRTDSFPPFDDEHVYIVSVPRHEFRLRGSPSVEPLIGWLSRVQKLLAVEQCNRPADGVVTAAQSAAAQAPGRSSSIAFAG